MLRKERKVTALVWMALLAFLASAGSAFAHPAVQLLDRDGNPIVSQLSNADTFVAANGTVYKAGPAYSPKKTCGKCHDYNAITRAYHFREGVGPNGEILSDQWSDKNNDGTLYKYLANAYGHLLSPGQYGAW
jgi:hypothetical protein